MELLTHEVDAHGSHRLVLTDGTGAGGWSGYTGIATITHRGHLYMAVTDYHTGDLNPEKSTSWRWSMFKVYRVQQVTWNNHTMSDFNLPRTLGYFDSEAKALNARDRERMTRKYEPGTYASPDDYEVTIIEVN